ncbi:MAG: DUF1993 domain-containing protein [Patescibacteria group bacterium]
MKTNLYTVTVLPMTKMLESSLGILDKAAAHAASKQLEWQPAGMQESSLLNSHLIFSQFGFIKQIQVACDNAKNGVARLAKMEPPKHEDNEKTVLELKSRVEKTLAFLKTIKPENLDGGEDVIVTLLHHPGKSLSGFDYATLYLMPNFYFHMTTAYAILRKNGVDLGKTDYLNNIPWQNV